MKNEKFYRVKNDRKYTSLIDEYRRYYVTGKNFKIKQARGKNLGNKIFELAVMEVINPLLKHQKQTTKDSTTMSYDKLVSGFKFPDAKYKKKITVADFKKNRRLILQYEDTQHNIYRIVFESRSNKSHKISYSEWIKKDKTFFGMSDTVGKFFMRRTVVRKSKLLKRKINFLLFGLAGKKYWFEQDKQQTKTQHRSIFIKRKLPGYDQDLGSKFDPTAIKPDQLSTDQQALSKKLKNLEQQRKET